MQPDLLIFFLVLVAGCAAFFFGVLYVLSQVIAAIGRGIGRLFGYRPATDKPRVLSPRRGTMLVCPHPRCGKVERRPARFCSQCGARLTKALCNHGDEP
jgi:hypothetical protein